MEGFSSQAEATFSLEEMRSYDWIVRWEDTRLDVPVRKRSGIATWETGRRESSLGSGRTQAGV